MHATEVTGLIHDVTYCDIDAKAHRNGSRNVPDVNTLNHDRNRLRDYTVPTLSNTTLLDLIYLLSKLRAF